MVPMPLQPLTITLSDGQKIEALKRTRAKYQEELAQLDADLTEILTAFAEADFLGQYLGEQPEITALKARRPEADKLEKRRQHIGLIIERLDQIIPKQTDVKVPTPGTAGSRPASGAGGIRKY